MDKIDYEEGICCPEGHDDEQALMDFVIRDDNELLFLDSYLRDILGT